MRIILTVQELLPSLNAWQRWHWAKRHKYTRDLAWLVWEALTQSKEWRDVRPYLPFQRARVSVTRYSTGTLDKDNLYGGAKPLLDCLKSTPAARGGFGLGILVDDDPKHCDLVMTQTRLQRGIPPTIFIVIEEMEGASSDDNNQDRNRAIA